MSMERESPRSWWQTIAGIITATAALITAVAGLMMALKQIGLLGQPEQKAAPNAASPALSSLARSQSTPSQAISHAAPVPSNDPNTGSAVPALNQKPYSVPLPARREYVLGNSLSKAK